MPNDDSGTLPSGVQALLIDAAWQQVVGVVRKAAGGSERMPRAGFRQAPELPHDAFPGYRVLGEIHRGGQGVVYKALQESTQRHVAIKVLRDSHLLTDSDISRFEQEVRILGRLRHANIVRIFDSAAAEGRFYYVMDYISGLPLDAYVRQAQPGLSSGDDVVRLFVKICDAVNAAHLRGIIHRDLKPGNIRVDDEGEPYVLDFGLSKLADADSSDVTLSGQFVGSIPWASPEQAQGRSDELDVRTDVYSLGVLLYQMLTAQFPYSLEGRPQELLARIVNSEPASPRTHVSSITADLETIILKCLQKQPERRFQTAGELGRDLRHYLAREPIEARRDSYTYFLAKRLARYRVAAVTSGAFLVVLIGALVVSVKSWREADAARADAELRRSAEERERRSAVAINEFVTRALVSSDPREGGAQGLLVTAAMDQAIALLDAGALKDQPETEARLRLTIAMILNGNARPEDALRLAQQSLRALQDLHDGDHSDVAASLNEVGSCLRSLGRSAEALLSHEAALAMRRRLFAGDHSEVAASLNNVAACVQSLGRSAEALPKLEAALEMCQRLSQGDHSDVAFGLINVADCLRSLGRSAQALPKYEAALAMRQRLFPGDHPETATSLNAAGSCLRSLGRSSEALRRHELALAMRQRLFSGDHPDVAASLNSVALCLKSSGRPAEALPHYEAALEMYRRVFQGDHPDIALSLNNVAACLRSLGRSAEALPSYEAALEVYQRVFPGDHPEVAVSLNNVAGCLKSLGRLAEALPRYEAALEMSRRVLPPGHADTLYPQLGLAATLLKLGRPADAERLMMDAVDQCQRFESCRQIHLRFVLTATIALYDAWHAAEPDKGYDAKAVEWRAKFVEWQASTQPSPGAPSKLPAES